MSVENAWKSNENKENGSEIPSNVPAESLPNSIDLVNYDVVWEYEVKMGHWAKYKQELSEKLNGASTSVIVKTELEESELNIDLSIMKQVNMVSGFRRNVRCAVKKKGNESFVVWEYQKGRRYYPFPRNISVQLEETQCSELSTTDIDFEDLKWSANITEMTMSSENGQKYKFRRIESHAESAISASPVPLAQRTRTVTRRGWKSIEYKDTKTDALEDDNLRIPSKKIRHRKSKNNYALDPKGNTKSTYKSGKRTVIVKGSVPVDPECVEKLKTAHVLSEGNVFWDAMLNQTNIGNNNNKFYILQLLEDDDSKYYSVWFRWGRVGYRGQTLLQNFETNVEAAKAIFCKKFFDKTRNEWSDRSNFENIPGKYTLIYMDYCTQNGPNVGKDKDQINNEDDDVVMQESKLDDRIKSLLALICNIRAMEETVMELEYDSTRAPLGKLTTNQISEGYRCLKNIEEFIKRKSFGRDFLQCVNEYYTKIPHAFGFHQPPLIKTIEELKKETELLEVLTDIEVAIRTLGKGKIKGDNRPAVDRYYENMCCHIRPLESDGNEYKMVERYLNNTHGRTHLYKMKLHNVFAVEKDSEKVTFMEDIGNRVLLWHGSRLTNWYGILSQSLRIAPPEAPSTGYMFGKGIYFADMASKSGNYCYPSKGKPGLLMLAEVALGNSQRLYDADYKADNLPKGKHSTMGVGSCGPDPSQNETTADGVCVPLGTPMDNEEDNSHYSLIYNEYVVYNTAQIKMRYVVEVEFDM